MMRWCTRPNILSLVVDAVLFLLASSFVALSVYGPIPALHARVTCDDPSTRKPYFQSTINTPMLLGISLFLPFIVMTALEWAVPPPGENTSPLHQGLRRSLYYTWNLLIGFIFMYCLIELSKVLVGEARPHFWNVCAPNVTNVQCLQPYLSVSWEDCTNPFGKSKRRVVAAMKSFPSGHAAVSVYSTVFMIVYIKARLWNRCSRLIAPWLQIMWATWAIFCCQSRVWDNQHHWWDVLAGGLFGAFSALLTLHYIANWFVREESMEKEVITADPEYVRHNSRFSHTSVKRLISTNSETENHVDQRLDNRELTDINGTP